MIKVIKGQVQKFYIYPDEIALNIKSRIPAQQIKCWIDGVIFIGVFTIVKVAKGDSVKIMATINDDETYTAHVLLNLSNHMLHMHPYHGNSLKQTFAEVMQLAGVGGLFSTVLMSLLFSMAHYNLYQQISIQPLCTAVVVGFWGAIFFLILGILLSLLIVKYPIQTRQIFELLEFPYPAQLSLFKNINRKGYKVQWLTQNCHYWENKKRFLGVFDCREVFGDEVDEVINKKR